MSTSSRNGNEEKQSQKLEEEKTNTKHTFEFLPDWMKLIEDARNESLPEVKPINEDDELADDKNFRIPQVKIPAAPKVEEIIKDSKSSFKTTPKSLYKKTSINHIQKLKNLEDIQEEYLDSKEGHRNKITHKVGATHDSAIDEFLGNTSENKTTEIFPTKTSSSDPLRVTQEDPMREFGLLPLKTPIKNAGKENYLNVKPNSLQHMKNRYLTSGSVRQTPIITPSSKTKTLIKSDKKPINRQLLITPTTRVSKEKSNNDLKAIKINSVEFITLRVLGKGGSSTVYQCFDTVSKENRAIKCVTLDSQSSESFKQEIEVLKSLQNCDRIIKMFDYEISKHKLYVILEMGDVDFSHILREFKEADKTAPSYLILFYWMEMLYAVEQIHSKGIIHSDLKPANFLQVKGRLKLIDFGISSNVQDDQTSVIKTVSEGTGNYISPEALNCEQSNNTSSPNYGKKKYRISYKADVWSLGCILYQLIYKKTPFQHIISPIQKLLAIANASEKIEFPYNDKVPRKFLETVKKCLIFNAKSRPSVRELILDYKDFT